MLAVMFSGRHEITRDENGRFFVDRDGKYFRYILNFIRSNDLPPDSVTLEVLKEAEFFCMVTLIEKLESNAPKVIFLLILLVKTNWNVSYLLKSDPKK